MQLNKRLATIFSELTNCNKFADIGCDHGYIAKAMIDSGKAKTAVISDISAKSLHKAEELLASELGGRVTSVVSDGLKDISADCDEVLIAGMGGEEICNIISSAPFLPERLVLQPMKNADKVRKRLLLDGYRIVRDYIFEDGKFYVLLVCERGRNGHNEGGHTEIDEYTEEELIFGRDNLRSPSEDFKKYARAQYEKYTAILKDKTLPPQTADSINKLISVYGGFIK